MLKGFNFLGRRRRKSTASESKRTLVERVRAVIAPDPEAERYAAAVEAGRQIVETAEREGAWFPDGGSGNNWSRFK
jgi:hypothetical protein